MFEIGQTVKTTDSTGFTHVGVVDHPSKYPNDSLCRFYAEKGWLLIWGDRADGGQYQHFAPETDIKRI